MRNGWKVGFCLGIGFFVSILALRPVLGPWLKTLTTESKRILGLEKKAVFPEEKMIRDEVILKKMEEASLQFDWRAIAPEYPRPRNLGNMPEKERMKILRETPEFKEMDREVKEYAKKKEDLFKADPPLPSARGSADFTQMNDRATEKAIQKLLGSKEKTSREKPSEENLRLRIKGPVASRKILERPSLPSVKVRVEAEIELMFWVFPDGMVDRVIPSVKGDAELERIAVQYLKQWRFVPLPKDQPQVEQWGTIPIKFKIR
ncbi:MAG: energy transducer TonB [Deltaproteobacteria bacterium]|nr:MAG: energy transducer TonB [Deltaproteobacteria bacterium]